MTFLFDVISFVIILWVLWKYVRPLINRVAAERQEKIRVQFEEAAQAKADAESAESEAEAQMADIQAEASRIREEAQEQGEQIIAQHREQAQVEAERITANAQAQIEVEHAQALAQLRGRSGRSPSRPRAASSGSPSTTTTGRSARSSGSSPSSRTTAKKAKLMANTHAWRLRRFARDRPRGRRGVHGHPRAPSATSCSPSPACSTPLPRSAGCSPIRPPKPRPAAGWRPKCSATRSTSTRWACSTRRPSSRWASGRDLSDAIELAGLAAHVAAADKDGSLDTLEDELFEGQRIIDESHELRGVLADRSIPAEHKSTLLDSIFGKKVSKAALALLKQAAATRTGSFDAVLARFADEVAARRQRVLAEVRSAYELGKAESKRLAEALSATYGQEVHLNVIVDPAIVGGLRVSIGDDVIDGTVAGRLEDARRQLAG